jgi:mRNA deadenylase 3'-5' endonuclease subunit Ccr4
MYLPPLTSEEMYISTWEYRKSLLQDRIGLVDADVVCFQEVSPLTFEDDFGFMSENLGYDGVELFKKVNVNVAMYLLCISTLQLI